MHTPTGCSHQSNFQNYVFVTVEGATVLGRDQACRKLGLGQGPMLTEETHDQ